KIMYDNGCRDEDGEKELGGLYVGFDTLLEDSDFIICTALLTKETENKFNGRGFKKMKKDGIFMKIGGGGVVDEEGVIGGLENGDIGGCGLDVVGEEGIDMLRRANGVLINIGSLSKDREEDIL
ncbi:NAD(P)-dependent oxidoreductase, partial [Staphylococcus saprophyticus]|uniref:NAD(P)-dependent oxidoreductase n=1 Tax=Staphylococcus saprophyticus TaxID=29385 RepID=UPI0028CB5E67